MAFDLMKGWLGVKHYRPEVSVVADNDTGDDDSDAFSLTMTPRVGIIAVAFVRVIPGVVVMFGPRKVT